MSLKIKNKLSKKTVSKNEEPVAGYTCIGSYEDKPKNRIYYFLHSDDESGISGNYDCIAEYDQFSDSSVIVYQDGRKGSNGHAENILNFSKSHLITGVNKVEDFLYWTDNLNRPRKINVEKAKVNEARINSAPRFGGILKELGGDGLPTTVNDPLVDGAPNTGGFFLNKARIYLGAARGETSTKNVLLVNVDDNNPFLKDDHLYLQQSGVFTTTEAGYNGYCKAVGVVRSIGRGTSISTSTNSKDVTGVDTQFLDDVDAGDFICIVLDETIGPSGVRVPYIYEVDEVLSNTSLKLATNWHTTGTSINSANLDLTAWNPDLDTNNAIITSCPATAAYGSNGGRIFYADPEDAYSPLISFGTYDDKVKYIDALARQPKHKPGFSFSKSSSTLNNLIGKFFQFRYRYVYKDGSVSAYSRISDVANQDAYAIATTNEDNNSMNRLLHDTINIEYNDDVSCIDKVEVVARNGNKGEFFLVSTIKNDFIKYLKKRKNEDLIIAPSSYFGGSTQFNVAFSSLKFTNDSIYPFVDIVDLDKLQDAVPKKAKAQTILPKNRIAYGNVVDGYDNTDIYCSMNFASTDYINSVEESISTTLEVSSAGSPGGFPTTSDLDTVLKFEFNLGNIASFDGSNGGKNIIIDLDWDKFLFQNHGSGVHPYASLCPRSGKFTYNTLIYSPQFIDDIGSHIENDINIHNAGVIESGKVTFNNGITFESEPNSVSATYSNGILALNFIYTAFQNTQALLSLSVPDYEHEMWSHHNLGIGQTLHYDTDFSTSDTNGLIEHYGASGDVINNNSFYKAAAFFGNSYKAGANHAFGLVYYDETNRCSFVNTSKPINSHNSGTKIYSKFFSEKNVSQAYFNHVKWKIYHKPPEWATHYQWVYGGNTSVDEFIQIPIHAAYKGNSQNKVYLSLGALKGEDLSYNEENPSLIDYQYVEGDRVRFISFGGNPAGDESERKYFKEYVDVPISSYDLYTVEDIVELTTETTGDKPMDGYFIVIKNPADNTDVVEFSPNNNSSNSYDEVDISWDNINHDTNTNNGYHKLVVEIYRPKKIVEGEGMGAYYEVGDKMEVEDPGSDSRRHQGQANNFFFDEESGMMVTAKDSNIGSVGEDGSQTTNYAHGVLRSGDVYTRVRKISHWRGDTDDTRVLTDLNCESYYLNDFYESNNWNMGRVNIENPYSEERRLPASVYFSDTFSGTASYNGLSSFNMNDINLQPYYDYNQDFGSIQSLMLRGDDLIIFHENKVGRVLVGKNVLNYADGDSNLAVSSKVLSDYAQVYSGDNGCSLNPESIVKYKDRFYFVDIKRGAVLRLSADGLTRISDYGMSGFFRGKGEVYISLNPEESTDGEFKIIAGYDPKYDEYVVTLPSMIDANDAKDSGLWGSNKSNWDVSFSKVKNLRTNESESYTTIAYNEALKKWTSFYSYNPEFYGKINRQFVTFKEGHLYKQNSNNSNFNTFYGETFNSVLDFPFNAEVSSVKSYNAISLESDTKLLTRLFTNMGQYNNSNGFVVSTSIGFKKVDGNVSSNASNVATSIINGSSDSNFYKDLAPGDLIRIYNDSDTNIPTYRVVKEIKSKNKVLIDNGFEAPFNNVKLEVIDYKTKEGTQYSQIPFVPSKINSYEGTEFQGNYDGDASNIFGLGFLSNDVQGTIGTLTETEGSEIIKNLPFKGSKIINPSEAITGGNYIQISSSRGGNGSYGNKGYRANNVSYGLDNSLISQSLSRFNNSSDWTVVSSGVHIQSDTMGKKGNVALFEKKATPPEVRTTSALSYKSGDKFNVSFYVDTLNTSDGDAVIDIRLGKITKKTTSALRNNASYGYATLRQKNQLISSRKLVSIDITAGDHENDPHLYIRSNNSSGSFSISNLSVVKVASSRSESEELIFPAEYSLYCLDSGTGESTHEGWVYNIADTYIKYKIVTSTSTYNSSGSSQGTGGNSADQNRSSYGSGRSSKFYFIVKDGFVDGEKLKGHYLKTKLISHQYQSKNKFNLYSANVDVDKSELSGNK